jgi:hypothetical protein
MRSTDEDVIAERRHEELTQMKLERIVRKATPARSQSKVMKAFCDPDLHYLVTPDNPADLEDETEEEHYDEDLVKEHGIVDSGASISVTNPETAKHFGLDFRPWNKPKKITFGNGQVVESTHYVNFNDIFTHVAIIENAPDTLFSIANLIRRGFEIRMSRMGMGVFLGDIIVFRGAIDLETGMFYLDIEEMRASSFKIDPPTAAVDNPAVA